MPADEPGYLWGDTFEEEIRKHLEINPIEFEGRIDTLNRPLIIECAFPGWQSRFWGARNLYPREPPGYREDGIRFPAVPQSIDDQVKGLVDAVRAGAAAVHLHPRDPRDARAVGRVELVATVYERVFDEVDAITLQHSWKRNGARLDYITDAAELLRLGHGNTFNQGAVVLWPPADSYPSNYAEDVERGVTFMLEHKIRPVHKVRSSYSVRKMKRTILERSIQSPPHIVVHDMGHPFGWPMSNDTWMGIELIASLQQTKDMIPGCTVGVYGGGRNWLPITLLSILAGVDLVRVGIEDCYWMYPHRDEVITRNLDMIKKVVDFCRLINRPIATVQEARSILGIERTVTSAE